MKFFAVCVCLLALVAGLHAVSLQELQLSRALAEKSEPEKLGDIWKDCSKPGDKVKIVSLVITPNPPEKGKNITGKGNITTSGTITGGSIEVKLKWGFIQVIDQKVNLCDTLKDAGLSCPLAAGSYSVSQSAAIPGEAPKGHYTGSVVVTDSSGAELLCIDLDFHME